jgi:hypothetical protein
MLNEKLETAFRKPGTWRPPRYRFSNCGGKMEKSSARFSNIISNSVTTYRPTQAIAAISFGTQPSQEVNPLCH